MKMRVKFTQSDNNETTFCTIKYGDEVYTGLAKCHPDDMDFANTLTGQEIAYKRALAAMLKAEIKSTRQELKIFNNFYNSIKQSKKFNDKCYAAYRLRKEIKILETTLNELKSTYNMLNITIKSYLMRKDELYKQLRKRRGQNQETQSK